MKTSQFASRLRMFWTSIPFHPRDIGPVVEEYLSEVHRLGFPAVRIIHGRGIGVQRETVSKILERTPFVESFSDAPPKPEAGARPSLL